MKKNLRDFTVSEHSTMQDAIALIQKNESRCVVLVRDDGKVAGVFSEGDVLRAILAGIEVHTPLRNLVKPSFWYLRSRDLKAARVLFQKCITLVPVLDDEFRLKDVITLQEFFKKPIRP